MTVEEKETLPPIEYPVSNYVIIQENSLLSPKIPRFIAPNATLGVFYTEDDIISCLIEHESGGNPEAVGDNGLAKGILQFHRSTFDLFKNKYGLDYLEYDDAESQIILTKIMLKEDINLIKQWSIWQKCYSFERSL